VKKFSLSLDKYDSDGVQYGEGRYEMLNENDDSLAECFQMADPELYDGMVDRYNRVANSETVY
jgi:hypothetical protein